MRNKFALFSATFVLALTFILSCTGPNNSSGDSLGSSSSKGGGAYSGSHLFTKTFAIEMNQNDSTFTYIEREYYNCEEGGVLNKKSYEQKPAYSINGNVLVLWTSADNKGSEDDDSLHFNGTSSSIIGTWTRTKSKIASCDEMPEYVGCKDGYDIVKAEISQNTLKITSDVCATDIFKYWMEVKVIDCNTYELSEGNEKAIAKYEWSSKGELISQNLTYNGKTCKLKRSTEAEMKKACKEAWADGRNEDSYREILRADYHDCMEKNKFPSWLF